MLILSGASSARVTFFSHLVKAVSHKGLEIASMNTEDVVSPMGPKNQSILWAHCPTQAAALRGTVFACGTLATSRAALWGADRPPSLQPGVASEHVHCPLPITRLLLHEGVVCFMPHTYKTQMCHISQNPIGKWGAITPIIAHVPAVQLQLRSLLGKEMQICDTRYPIKKSHEPVGIRRYNAPGRLSSLDRKM